MRISTKDCKHNINLGPMIDNEVIELNWKYTSMIHDNILNAQNIGTLLQRL